jgi:hypothetical protein
MYTKQLLNKNTMVTPEGGIAEVFVNKTGANSVKGTWVHPGSTVSNSVEKCEFNIPNPIGVIYNDGVPDGSEVYVVTEGKAYALFNDSVAINHLARGLVTGDATAAYTAGIFMSEAVPVSPFSDDKHFYEGGHTLEARSGAGLALTKLHFN